MICEACNKNIATEKHHRLSQSKLNRRLYGDLLESPHNIMYLCYDCHHNKPVEKLSELEFCKFLGIEPRSKTGEAIWERMKNENIDSV